MDQIKIGEFISLKRKEKNITQRQLAEMLNITDRAVSKWENGICLPDAGNMPELCRILGITINDLFSGEVVDMMDNNKAEENLLKLKKENEEKDRRLLSLELAMGIPTTAIALALMMIAALLEMPTVVRGVIIALAFVLLITVCVIALLIEQKAGYYECQKCHHKYVPTYAQVFFAMHYNRTRFMKCPECKKYSWSKKVIKK